MKVAALVASRNRPDLVADTVAQLRKTSIDVDVYVVECGTDRDKLSEHSTLWYADPDFRGKCWGHHLAYQAARSRGDYDYYWVVMNDLVLEPGVDVVRQLVETLEHEDRMAILSPTNAEGGYPGADQRPGGGWRAVTTCDYLGLMMKARALEEVGFLNPAFQYCWGAIHELAYELYRGGWFVAYSDDVTYRHLGGSTYGVRGTNTISREEYQNRAKRFAFDWFREHYGDDWNEVFWAATRGHAIETDTFTEHRAYWATGFTLEELQARMPARRARKPHAERMLPPTDPDLVKVHLGCGPERREGWLNVDTNPESAADLVSRVEALPSIATDSVDVIEANHLFEHLTWNEAHDALAEWHRILRPGGELFLEMPDREACIRILGRYQDDRGFDIGTIGLFGWPPVIAEEGYAQVHKWVWSRAELRAALSRAGFSEVEFGKTTQTWRYAAKLGSDVRVRARKADPEETAAPVATPAVAVAATEAVNAGDPFELATTATLRVFAWPRWDDPAELDELLSTFGRPLADRDDACLCLRRSPAFDPDEASAIAALEAAYARVLGTNAALEVLIVDDELELADWPRIGRSIQCVARLGSASQAPRRGLLKELDRPFVDSAEGLGAPAVAAVGP